MNSHVRTRLDRVLSWIEKGYPTLSKLEGDLRELGLELGEPLPENGTLHTTADYGRAVVGLGKFLIAIGRGLIALEEDDDGNDS